MQILKRRLKRQVINFSKQSVLKQFLTIHTAVAADLLRQNRVYPALQPYHVERVFKGPSQKSRPSWVFAEGVVPGLGPQRWRDGTEAEPSLGLRRWAGHGVSLGLTGQHDLCELLTVQGNDFLSAAVLQRACSRNRKSQGSHILKHPERTRGRITAADMHLLNTSQEEDALPQSCWTSAVLPLTHLCRAKNVDLV